ncbi:FecR domain-containing protein [Pedobacter sp. MC2016-24]|uniref:FecR domain-containing protein n=1 Tax=Pedobacter sp. MC2016-24 TaxID=2780090 RepID=UPI001881D71D|nr:FecR domain-containing protein [Pedobacter sp. MC2016-24]MBE9599270.1 FecR domain-containing protein [Pedobacter sp. MC2016-24]
MNEDKINMLSDKIVKGTVNEAELAEFNEWYTTYEDVSVTVNSDQNEDALAQRMFKNIAEAANLPVPKTRKVQLWPRIAIAASILLIAGAGLFYTFKQHQKTEQTNAYLKQIKPGGNGAILTLADGRKIRLDAATQGELANEAGVRISKTKDGQILYEIKGGKSAKDKINTLSTEKGETYVITLPDQSTVYLNAASSLSYPASFAELNERRVELSGEAYFEVAKDAAHPFIVRTMDQEIQVLGTHFNVNSYRDELATKTTLLEGSVHIGLLSGKANAGIVIKPGQQAYIQASKIYVNQVKAEDAIAWKNGYFRFNDETLEQAMNKIARWYNVQIEYQDESIKRKNVYGSLSRFSSIADVLNLLELTETVKFEVVGNKIIVLRK